MTLAMREANASTCASSGPSTITRASGSVPENRTSTRPAAPSDASAARTGEHMGVPLYERDLLRSLGQPTPAVTAP